MSIGHTGEPDSTTESLLDLAGRAEQEFRSKFSRVPSDIVAAPGRVNLIGEHIDYNDGFVLPMAVNRYVVIAGAPKIDQAHLDATIYSVNVQATASVKLNGVLEPSANGWVSYVEGVIAGFIDSGTTIPAFDAVVLSSVPIGGGLSSSAALEVALATTLESITGIQLDSTEKALLCQRAEHRFAGVPCGIMDQFSSLFGKPGELMLLDCRSQQIQPVPFDDQEVTILVTNSNVKHELTGGEYAERRAQCDSALRKLSWRTWRDVTMNDLESKRSSLSSVEYRRARHVVSEIQRTIAAAQAFQVHEWGQIGQLMYASHASLRDDYEVSCPELDELVVIAREIGEAGGVFGARMTGGGFGGCTVALVKSVCVEAITESLASRYEARTGVKPHCFASRPARGAHVLRR